MTVERGAFSGALDFITGKGWPITPDLSSVEGDVLGRSRKGRDVIGFRFGSGGMRISLLGGCHADEPVGPHLLESFVSYLGSLSEDHELLTDFEWWILPHINPDGRERNRAWSHTASSFWATGFDPISYFSKAIRELPGDDIEFGFPRDRGDRQARPENLAAWDWWTTSDGPFDLHISFHGTSMGAGPWFLIEPTWADRTALLRGRCSERVAELDYILHDVDRRGEKGFNRIERGFCTRPDSEAMRDHFLGLGDPETAGRFRPSSMETFQAFGGNPLTLVSEMPLFITPGVGETLGPPDPIREEWMERIGRWKVHLRSGGDPEPVLYEIGRNGLFPMPVVDQIRLQWRLLEAGIENVKDWRGSGPAGKGI